MKKVERVTDYSFIYSEDVEKQWTIITINELDVSIQKLLDQVFLKQPIGYRGSWRAYTIKLKKEANQSCQSLLLVVISQIEVFRNSFRGNSFEHKKSEKGQLLILLDFIVLLCHKER